MHKWYLDLYIVTCVTCIQAWQCKIIIVVYVGSCHSWTLETLLRCELTIWPCLGVDLKEWQSGPCWSSLLRRICRRTCPGSRRSRWRVAQIYKHSECFWSPLFLFLRVSLFTNSHFHVSPLLISRFLAKFKIITFHFRALQMPLKSPVFILPDWTSQFIDRSETVYC